MIDVSIDRERIADYESLAAPWGGIRTATVDALGYLDRSTGEWVDTSGEAYVTASITIGDTVYSGHVHTSEFMAAHPQHSVMLREQAMAIALNYAGILFDQHRRRF